jgi:hypothetical protein
MEETTQTTKPVTIFVNDKPVVFDIREVTGLQIKAKAGVPTDSTLFELKGTTRVPIGDNEEIEIHENERFLDVPGGTVS